MMNTIWNQRATAWRTTAAVMALAAAGAAPATAQEAADGLEEIVVTARKVAENIQDVPLTVSAISGERLADLGTPDAANVANFVPNMIWDVGSSNLRNEITIRGIPSNQTFQGFDPGVGIYVDEVYQANGLGFNIGLLDIERIEVLKGPQGSLFGRNTIAGAVSIVTRRPSYTPYVQADLTVGNYDLRQVRGIVNTPVVPDRLAVKGSVLYRTRDGYQVNRVDGSRVNDEDQLSGRLQALLTPSEDVTLLISADVLRDRSDQLIPDCGGPSAFGLGAFCSDDDITDREVESNGPNRADRDSWGVTGNLNWDVGAAELVSITAYRELEVIVDQDQDFTKFPALRGGLELPDQQQFSQEFRLNSSNAEGLRWVGGLYYFNETKSPHIPILFKREILNAIGLPVTSDLRADTFSRQKTDSLAAFGQLTFDLSDRFSADVGLRYSHDKKSFTYEQQVDPRLRGVPGVPVAVARTRDQESWGALSGTASLSYRPNDDVMAYLRYARGYKSGGYNAGTANPGQLNTRPYDPEYVDNIELGFKSDLLDRRLRLNGSVFYIRYDDIQFQVTNANRERFIDNAGKAESKGIELELAAMPAEGLSLNLGVGLQDAEYKSFAPGATTDLSGKELSNSPNVTATTAVTYRTPLTERLSAYVAANAAYRSDNYLNDANTVEQQGYALVNARIGLEGPNERWALHLFANNLTEVVRNVDYGGGGFFYTRTADTIAPRTYGVEARVRF